VRRSSWGAELSGLIEQGSIRRTDFFTACGVFRRWTDAGQPGRGTPYAVPLVAHSPLGAHANPRKKTQTSTGRGVDVLVLQHCFLQTKYIRAPSSSVGRRSIRVHSGFVKYLSLNSLYFLCISVERASRRS
jgi:hypothetical protein